MTVPVSSSLGLGVAANDEQEKPPKPEQLQAWAAPWLMRELGAFSIEVLCGLVGGPAGCELGLGPVLCP